MSPRERGTPVATALTGGEGPEETKDPDPVNSGAYVEMYPRICRLARLLMVADHQVNRRLPQDSGRAWPEKVVSVNCGIPEDSQRRLLGKAD